MDHVVRQAIACANRYGLTVELVDEMDDDVEAFPGGVAYLPIGRVLVDTSRDSEDYVAYVILHEVAHWILATPEQRCMLNFESESNQEIYDQEDDACAIEAALIEEWTQGRLRHLATSTPKYRDALSAGMKLLQEHPL